MSEFEITERMLRVVVVKSRALGHNQLMGDIYKF